MLDGTQCRQLDNGGCHCFILFHGIFRVVLGELQVRVAFARSNCLQYVFFLK